MFKMQTEGSRCGLSQRRPSQTWALWTVGGAMFLFGATLVLRGVVNHDVAWMLYAAGQVVDGATLYVDLIEINPPLIVWLKVPLVLLARWLGLGEVLVFKLFVLALIAVSVTLSAVLLRPIVRRGGPLLPALVLVLLFAQLFLVGYDFGQREHLTFILIAPYLMATCRRACGRRLRISMASLVGVLAGIGFALKPHFLLVWLAVEAYLATSRRGSRPWLRAENLAVVTTGAVYIGAVLVFSPEYFSLMARVAGAYSGFSVANPGDVFFQLGTSLTVCALLGMLLVRPTARRRHVAWVFLLTAAAFLAVAFIQDKGFVYHFYPAAAAALLALVVLGVDGITRPRAATRTLAAALVVPVAVLAVVVPVREAFASPVWSGTPVALQQNLGQLVALARRCPAGSSLYVFSAHPSHAFPLVTYSGARWPCKFSALWPLPGLYADEVKRPGKIEFHPLERVSGPERELLNAVADGLADDPPALLLVDASPSKPAFGGKAFDYLAYFSREPRFADFIARYEQAGDVGMFRVYRRRNDPVEAPKTVGNETPARSYLTITGDPP